ncbi:MAG TPA: hypothetical protein VFP36_09975, partial [Usitatibacter sp.]|nr:hypothetical protein [Usitatibacter sp.]
MSAVLDNRRLETAHPAARDLSPEPPVIRNNALMDALFRNLTRVAAFFVFALLAGIVVSLAIGSAD